MVVTAAPLHNADAADVEEAGLVWGRLARLVANPGIAAAQLARAPAPVYWVTWNRDVVTPDAVGRTDSINRICCLLRNPPLLRSEYDRLVAFPKEAYSAASILPPELVEWRASKQRHRLEMQF